MGESYSEAFSLIAELACALGAAPINARVGCWEHRIGDTWLIAVNGHKEPALCSAGEMPVEVPPFHAYIERNGWPGALLSPFGGVVAGYAGDAENDIIDVLNEEIAKARSAEVGGG